MAVVAPSLTTRLLRVLPGVALLFGIGFLGKFLEHTFTHLRTDYPGIPFPHLEYVLWAILLGLAIGNTLGVAPLFRPGVATYELWLKLGIVFVGACLLLSLFALVAQRQETLTEDSPKFVTALEDWSPVIESSYATPRALKRFVNRVRYFAMQQTPDIPSSSLREKAISWIYRKICKLPLPPNRLETKPNISEDFLVGLAAIDAFGGATQRDRFGEENVSSAYELAKKKFCRPAADLTRFEDVYPKEQLLKCHGEYSILAAGAQPKN